MQTKLCRLLPVLKCRSLAFSSAAMAGPTCHFFSLNSAATITGDDDLHSRKGDRRVFL